MKTILIRVDSPIAFVSPNRRVAKVKNTHSPISGHEADLGQGIFEAIAFRSLGITCIGIKVPFSSLLDLGDDETARNIGNPISDLFVSIEG